MWLEFHCPNCDAKWSSSPPAAEGGTACPFCDGHGTFIGEHDVPPQLDQAQVEARQRAARIQQRRVTPADRACPFCAVALRRGANKTREHVLAQWIRDLPMFDGVVDAAVGGPRNWTVDAPEFRDGRVVFPVPRQHENKHPHPLAVTVAVCADCNNGWMSRLEVAVAPTLRPLIDGTSTSVASSARSTLARWVAKVALAFEEDDIATATSTAHQVLDVRFGHPSRGAVIWAAAWGAPEDVRLRHSNVTAVDPTSMSVIWDGSRMLIAVGHIAFYMLYTGREAFLAQSIPGQPWTQLWPDAGDFQLNTRMATAPDLDAIDGGGVSVSSAFG